MKVLYIAREPNVANLFLPIAKAFRKMYPHSEHVLVDPSRVFQKGRLEGTVSPAEYFLRHGFQGEILNPCDFHDLEGLAENHKLYLFHMRLFEHHQPSAIVVPHEMGPSFYAVQAARLMEIPSCHVQHGIWGPMKYHGYYDLPEYIPKKTRQQHLSVRLLLGKQLQILSAEYDLIKQASAFVKKRLDSITKKEASHAGELKTPEKLVPYRNQLISPQGDYPIHADHMLVHGPYYKRQLSEKRPDVDEEKVHVIGYLRSDLFYNNPPDSRETVYERYGLNMDGRLALYFYSPFQELPQYYRVQYHPNDALIDAIGMLKQVDDRINVLVLLHPNLRFDHYRKEIAQLVRKNRFDRIRVDRAHDDHFSLFKLATIVIGVKSGALYEAMLANVPVVAQTYVLSKIYDPQHVEGGAVAPVFSSLHLGLQLERVLKDNTFQERMYENQKMVCRDVLGPFDGKCGERAATVLANLIRKASDFRPDKATSELIR